MSKKIFLFYLLFASIGSVFNSVFGMDQEQQKQQEIILINSLKELEEFISPESVTSLQINLNLYEVEQQKSSCLNWISQFQIQDYIPAYTFLFYSL